jgi:phospholipid/cholesterol/gamma-HCH transport system ATP-binding protein
MKDTLTTKEQETRETQEREPLLIPNANDAGPEAKILTRSEAAAEATSEAQEAADIKAANDPTIDVNAEGNVVSIKGLFKRFKDQEILKGVTLHVRKGENLVVLGKSGSGKSVLIKCLVGLEWPDAGELELFGKDVSCLGYREMNEVRKKTGFLFQNAALYDSMTVRENLAFPLRQHKKNMSPEKKQALIAEMLDNVGLPEAIDQMPSRLSGGQNKRIGLARTLILRPELMLYDEPTTGLDTGTSKEISELILRLQKKYNISSILITHDMACARMTADRIAMLKDGVIVAEGTYEELEKSDDEWIKSFFS